MTPAERDMAAAGALLLRQGRRIDALSRPMTLIAAAALLLAPVLTGPLPWVVVALLVLVVALGLAECFHALRVDFDARMFAALGTGTALTTLEELDGALTGLGLMPPEKAGRPLAARLGGATALMRRQAALLLTQLLACLLAAVI
ncbi:MAG: hypothetical protein V4653_20370 [Pseudomonadota bacterium]